MGISSEIRSFDTNFIALDFVDMDIYYLFAEGHFGNPFICLSVAKMAEVVQLYTVIITKVGVRVLVVGVRREGMSVMTAIEFVAISLFNK